MMNQIKTGMNTALDPDLMEGKKKKERDPHFSNGWRPSAVKRQLRRWPQPPGEGDGIAPNAH
jgi:hypothetical protein